LLSSQSKKRRKGLNILPNTGPYARFVGLLKSLRPQPASGKKKRVCDTINATMPAAHYVLEIFRLKAFKPTDPELRRRVAAPYQTPIGLWLKAQHNNILEV